MSNVQHAEQSVLGALLLDNDAIDRIQDLLPEHFYNFENKEIYQEICKQILSGNRVDVITVFDGLKDKRPDVLPYLNQLAQSTPSSANIVRYAELVIDESVKRALGALGNEVHEIIGTRQNSAVCVDLVASKLEKLAERKTSSEPRKLESVLGNYVKLIEDRMEGKVMPIATGYTDLDAALGGGLERGTLTVVAGRPAMGKTAFGLGIARNAAFDYSTLFLSMEMPESQICDRNIAALGNIPLQWLKAPTNNPENFERMTKAFHQTQRLNLWIDDQTGLSLIGIRNKARLVKRKTGLDVLVIDQLSFITGSDSKNQWEAVGEYTRGLLAIGKELNIAIVLLCQLSREVEKRPNKRPMMSDLAMSGSIEQDAATIIFLYRDEVYNPDTMDKGVTEVIIGKYRQGAIGLVRMVYQGDFTRFDDLAPGWKSREPEVKRKKTLADEL